MLIKQMAELKALTSRASNKKQKEAVTFHLGQLDKITGEKGVTSEDISKYILKAYEMIYGEPLTDVIRVKALGELHGSVLTKPPPEIMSSEEAADANAFTNLLSAVLQLLKVRHRERRELMVQQLRSDCPEDILKSITDPALSTVLDEMVQPLMHDLAALLERIWEVSDALAEGKK